MKRLIICILLLSSFAFGQNSPEITVGNLYAEKLIVDSKSSSTRPDLTNYTVKLLLYSASTDVRPLWEFTYDNDHADADKTNGETVLIIYPYDYQSPFAEAWFEDADGTDTKLAYFGDTTSTSEYLNSSSLNWTFTFNSSDHLYLGRTTKFKWVKTTLATVGVAGTLTYEYWNGTAWTSLSVTDYDLGAYNFRKSGTFYFTVPSDWAKKTLSSEITGDYWKSCYWIRVTEGTNFTTNPIETTITTGGIAAGTYQVRRILVKESTMLDIQVTGYGRQWRFNPFGYN